jgi:hypothetical protein
VELSDAALTSICQQEAAMAQKATTGTPATASTANTTGQAAVVSVQDCFTHLKTQQEYDAIVAYQQFQQSQAPQGSFFDPDYFLAFGNGGVFTPYPFVHNNTVIVNTYRSVVNNPSRTLLLSRGAASRATSNPSSPFAKALGTNKSFQALRSATGGSPLSGAKSTSPLGTKKSNVPPPAQKAAPPPPPKAPKH